MPIRQIVFCGIVFLLAILGGWLLDQQLNSATPPGGTSDGYAILSNEPGPLKGDVPFLPREYVRILPSSQEDYP